MTRTLLSIGHGYSARALTSLLLADGWRVVGTTRSDAKAAELAALDVEPIVWPSADLQPALSSASHVLMSAAPSDDGDPFLNAVDLTGHDFDWVGYLSTTGVYGDHQGGWVDETTPLTPSTKRGQLRVRAEAQWSALGLPLHIFRLAGIYGPGRGPFSKVRAGTARRIIKPNQIFSRIHVADIAQVVKASIDQPNPGAIYNLCDNDPAPPEDVIGHAAELLKLPIPPSEDFTTAEMTPMARSFYAESKRVKNDRIQDELGVTLIYPDYRSGLADLLRQEDHDAGQA